MVVGNKIFAYPVLNSDPSKSTYIDKSFELIYEESDEPNQLVLKDVHFESSSLLLLDLFSKNKISVKCIVECSETVYRKCYDITPNPGNNIVINKADVVGKVVISAYAVSNENISIKSKEFISDYQGIEFEIEKYNILAVNDGYSFYANKEEKEDNVVHSIFSVIPSYDLNPEDGYDVAYNGRKIVIGLNEQSFNNYKYIYKIEKYKEVFFGMILVHALEMGISAAIKTLESGDYDLDDICSKYRWFQSVLNAYKLLEGEDLTREKLLDKYREEKTCLLAQKVLGNPINKSLQSLFDDNKPKGGDEDESD